MTETFVILLAGHLTGDFLIQTRWMVANKRKLVVLAIHGLIVTAITAAYLGSVEWKILSGVLLSHIIIDIVKTHAGGEDSTTMLLGQGGHIVTLAVLSWFFQCAATHGIWCGILSNEGWTFYCQALILVSGAILCVPFGGILIEKTISRFADDMESSTGEGLANGGKYIGWLERGLIFLLLLSGHPAAIGFLFAAKSILRFGEIKDASQRKTAEYIIIGTFMSFGWALLTAVLTQRVLNVWP